LALQRKYEEESNSNNHGDNHDGVKDPDVGFLDGDAEKQEANRDLCGNADPDVGTLS
jgi:hypothetical protein